MITYSLSHPQLSEPLEMDSHMPRTDRALIAWATIYIAKEFDEIPDMTQWTIEIVESSIEPK